MGLIYGMGDKFSASVLLAFSFLYICGFILGRPRRPLCIWRYERRNSIHI